MPVLSDDPGALAKAIFDALTNGEWKMLSILILVALLWVLRHYGSKIPKIGKYIGSRRGGAILALLTGLVGVIGSAMAFGVPITWNVVSAGFSAGLGLAGGWSVLKSLIQGEKKLEPISEPIEDGTDTPKEL